MLCSGTLLLSEGEVGKSSLAAYVEGTHCACVCSSPLHENHVAGWCEGSAGIDSALCIWDVALLLK